MTILIAEKPSVGRELAKAVNATETKNGYMAGGILNGDQCCVTWAIGHLVRISADTPQQWNRSSLPVLPERFTLEPVEGRRQQLETIRRLLNNCDLVVNCGDAGREGELIQRYILQWCGYRGPVSRLWISSLTDSAVLHGLRNLRPGKDYEPLFHAGRARDEADWLVGMNATMALTAAVRERQPYSKGVLSLGRVQTPTLAMVCSRYMEHRDFVPEDFWRIKLHTSAKGVKFEALSVERYRRMSDAESGRKRALIALLEVVSADTERRNVMPPPLHDLTSLQKTANSRYGMTADETLKNAQSLYEKKLLTYPRTGSRYITDDVMETMVSRLKQLVSEPLLGPHADALLKNGPSRRCVKPDKVSDHHALLTEAGKAEGMTETEKKIYLLVAERMIEAMSSPCIEDVMTVKLKASDIMFTASGTTVVDAGWKSVRKDPSAKQETADESEDKNQKLPQMREGDKLVLDKAELVKGITKPKPIHTESTLLAAMETAGKELEDQGLKEAMKGCGIGTPATRAAIIETIKKRGYVKTDGKKLIPTESGLAVWKLTKDMLIADVAMTGEWEQALEEISRSNLSEGLFKERIREYASHVTEQIFIKEIPSETGSMEDTDEKATCPLCGKEMSIRDEFAKCHNKDCGLYMNRTAFGKKLGKKTVKKLLENGTTGIVRGLKGKSGKEFEARLKLKTVEKDGRWFANVEPIFDSPSSSKKKTYGSSSRTKR